MARSLPLRTRRNCPQQLKHAVSGILQVDQPLQLDGHTSHEDGVVSRSSAPVLSPSQRHKLRLALRVGVVAENPVVNECRKRPFAVEVYAVVIVGGDDGHEDQ